ncbi:MAG: hypothetical protein AOA65_0301 [Candidatus Bathyarchaeota archaeon BA1]|nr:MAG: hypothetical protein AOA65_0301 [Candidatus Bathyarchaeota archaeon BA1]
MSLERIASRYEELKVKLSEQYYNQDAGLPYDKDLMKGLSQQITEVCLEFLKEFNEPRSMYLKSIETIADAERLEVELELHDQRMESISTEKYSIAGKKVNWGNWRQFNSQTDDYAKRKEVFDEFIEKAPSIASLVQRRMDIGREIYKRYHLSSLDSYLEFEGMTYAQLWNLLMRLGDGARDAFLAAADHYAPQVLGKKKVEYYDDFYTWRGRIFRPINKYFEGVNALDEVMKFLRTFGFDPTKIKVDDEDREKKSPSAFCFGIQIPNDVRVCYRKVSPFSDFGSVFHEFGHGIHGISANPNDSVWKRYILPRSVSETFSILIESMLGTSLYLSQSLKLDEKAINEILDRRRFMELHFITFYAANSIMKMEFWKKGYSMEEAAKRWQELTKRFFIEVPGNYWLLHHIMPNYDMYSPSYVIAALRVEAIRERLAQDYGKIWWKNPEAGEFVKQLAQTRGEFDVKVWRLDADKYLKEQVSLSFL